LAYEHCHGLIDHNGTEPVMSKKDDDDNHSRQLNPEHDADWQSRGYDERPDEDEE
jgi:hypothetical protein